MQIKACKIHSMRYLTLISILFSIQSCTFLKDDNKDNLVLKYTIDTLKINTRENGLSLTDAPYLLNKNTTEYYINYNEAFNVLLFFNLNTKDFEKKVQFKKSGPSQLHNCEEFVIKGDTIIVNDILDIKLFDATGELLKSINMENLCSNLKDEYQLSKPGINIGNLFKMDFNDKNNSIVLRTFRRILPYKDGFYKNPYFCEYNFDTESGNSISVLYPDELYGNMYYDDLATPNIISLDNLIIYNFHFKSSIYIYDKETKKTEEKKFHSQHIPDLVKGVKRSTVSGITNLFFGPKYYNLKYDEYNEKFYLLYSDGAKEQENKYLITFDKTFQKLGEITLPTSFSPNYVISKKGLLFRNIEDLDYYSFNLYAINIQNVNE